MKTRAALLIEAPGEFETHDVDLADPLQGEALVRVQCAGLCHSDDHLATGDLPAGIYPFCGGHEGAGVIEQVGPDTPGWAVGDHVVFSFVPACGHCRWCAEGKQNLCNLGANTLNGARLGEAGGYRMSLDGAPVGQMSSVSTFAEHTTVDVRSLIKVPEHLPLNRLALLSCGVSTGWGSAVNAANTAPGDTVIVMGIGGIGISAVQGARYACAANVIAVDPLQYKRDSALHFGASHAVATMAQAAELAREQTDGQGADAAIVTVGVTTGEHVGEAVEAIRKDGTVVVTGAGPATVSQIPVNLLMLTMAQKKIVGALFGMASPASTIPRLIGLYEQGRLNLDDMVTATYTIDQVAEGYRDLKAGKMLRGIVEPAARAGDVERGAAAVAGTAD